MMQLKSGHRVVEVEEEKNEEQKRLFKAYTKGVVKLQPGNWFYTRPFLDFADKIYDFKFRPTDIVIMTFPKAGTTWMQEIIWSLKHPFESDNQLDGFPCVALSSKYNLLEGDFVKSTGSGLSAIQADDGYQLLQKHCPGKDPKNGVFLQIAEKISDPRIIKTHLPFSLLAPSLLNTCKVVFVARNPKDVCVSFYHHSNIVKTHGYTGDFNKFFELFLNGEVMYGPFWKYLEEAWERREHPNLHCVHFEDLKSNPMKEISKLNDFLDTGLNADQIERISDETSFEAMKKKEPKKCNTGTCPLMDRSKGSFFRSGTVDSWKKNFTKEQNDKMNEWIQKHSSNGNNFRLRFSN
ncbi:UNVERIFIED_CONTAM: hypothetical protein RMT77_002939 [Armadillidium vulgare]